MVASKQAYEIQKEWELIQKAQKDPRQFEVIYRSNYEAIFRFIYARMPDESTTADICSQVFIKALEQIGSYSFKGVPYSAFLYRVAINEVNGYYRKSKKKRYVQIDTESETYLTSGQTFFESESTFDFEMFKKVINVLEPDELTFIEMRFFEGMSFREIGEIKGIKENKAKIKVFRILKRIRKRLAD